MNTQHYKLNITEIPTYKDGSFSLYEILNDPGIYPREYIEKISIEDIWYEELSISDSVRFIADQKDIKIEKKIRIPQMKEIRSLNVVKIDDLFLKVYNAYHFKNKNGILQTDLTLQLYRDPVEVEGV